MGTWMMFYRDLCVRPDRDLIVSDNVASEVGIATVDSSLDLDQRQTSQNSTCKQHALYAYKHPQLLSLRELNGMGRRYRR